MVFALDKDDGGLRAFPSAAEAAAQCKAVDVEDGFWLFFSDDGSPLEARLERGSRPADSAAAPGAYILQRAMSGRWLQERLDQVTRVEGCGLATVADLVESLKINRGKRVAGGAPTKQRGM
jgi:hypothetical protein